MRILRIVLAVTGALLWSVCLSPTSLMANSIVAEDFEGYADTAAMQVNWGAAGLGSLDTGFGNPGQSAAHPGGAVNTWQTAFSITPSGTEKIVLTADIYDDGGSNNERATVGLRTGANPLFEMGHYNGTSEHYHVRVLGMYGSDNWQPLQSGLRTSSGQPAGWNRYEATFTNTSLTVTLDLGADGSIDGTFTSLGNPGNAFTDLRFGGPSNLSSAGGGIFVDNISLSTMVVPEPSSVAIGLIACGLAFGLVRSRS